MVRMFKGTDELSNVRAVANVERHFMCLWMSKLVVMKIHMPLQAVSRAQAQRQNLKVSHDRIVGTQ